MIVVMMKIVFLPANWSDAHDKWEEALKRKIGWKGSEDLDALEYHEKYGYGFHERHLTPSELKKALKVATETKRFQKSDIEKFQRFIGMYCLL